MPRSSDPDQELPQRPICPTCQGATQVPVERGGETVWEPCRRCQGTGHL